MVTYEDSQVRATAANTLFSGRTKRALVLKLVDTLVGRLAVSCTFGNRPLSATTALQLVYDILRKFGMEIYRRTRTR